MHTRTVDTALDRAASERSTSVYLCGRRIDMLPDLLSSNLCSLQPYELRYAFSVIWVLDIEAKIQRTEFCKSLIKSRRKFTYQVLTLSKDNNEDNENVHICIIKVYRKIKFYW